MICNLAIRFWLNFNLSIQEKKSATNINSLPGISYSAGFLFYRIALVISILLVFLFDAANSPLFATDKTIANLINKISQENLRKHIAFLADDKLAGRAPGTNGDSISAAYISSKLKEYGIKPLGKNDSYFQFIPMLGSLTLPGSKLVIHSNGNKRELRFSEDYVLFKSGEQTFIPKPVKLVFAGYGISAPEYDYNDYANIDVEGKIVVILAGEPKSQHDLFFEGYKETVHSLPELKHRVALSRGAAGTIIIPNPEVYELYNWVSARNNFLFEDVSLPYSPASRLSILINPESADLLFESGKVSLYDIYNMHKSGYVKSFEMNSEMTFRGEFIEREFISSNIAGIIQGSCRKLRDSYILLSAHFDHLGIGPAFKGDSIYNGAYDNAAGVAALLEIARVVKEYNIQTKRSHVFLFTAAEEKGLLGSQYYCDYPLLPLYKSIANINVDGLAMFGDFYEVTAIGADFSNIEVFIQNALENAEVKLGKLPPVFLREQPFNSSDQLSFAKSGIPSVLILDLPNDLTLEKFFNYAANVYHTPFDELSQDTDFRSAAKHTALILKVLLEIADSEKEPQWLSNSPYINARLRSKAEGK